MNIGIVNYGLGNLSSVYSAFKFYNYNVKMLNAPSDFDSVDIIVLSGVGHFGSATAKLREMNLWKKLDQEVTLNKKPMLGICLGMQLFADVGFEGEETKGFGWIKGEVVKLRGGSIRVPHIGWDEVLLLDKNIFKGVRYNSFYFMHSFHFVPGDKNLIAAKTQYGDVEIVAAVKKDNIVGVQFHPEKSQGDGLRFLKNFVDSVRCYIKE